MNNELLSLGIPPRLVAALEKAGIREPFEIQQKTIPDALEGHDICGRAPTGSGKTIAFGIPLIIVLLTSSNPLRYTIPVVLAITAAMINSGCSEKIYRDATGNQNESLSLISKMCFSDEVFRWTDGVIQYLVISIVIWTLCVQDP